MSNTLVTISDNKIGVEDPNATSDNLADYYEARVLSATDYYAFGMAMKERSWQSESYRYGFNGKEKDKDFGEETTDFGARLMNSKIGRWMATDPLEKKYPSLSTYNFVANNPLNAIDPDGRKILFVNGYYNTGYLAFLAGSLSGQDYWGKKFIKYAGIHLENNENANKAFIDGRGKWNSTGEERFDAGYEYAKANYASITNGIFDAKGVQTETMKVVSHSMGGAYSEGIIKYLEEKGVNVEKVVHLSPADPSGFTASPKPMTLQINLEYDIVLGYKNFGEVDKIDGVDAYGDVKTKRGFFMDVAGSHADTKFDNNGGGTGYFNWGIVKDLEDINFEKKGHTFATPYGTITGASNTYNARGNTNNTQFNRVYKRGNTYTPTNKKNEYKSDNL